MNAMLKPVETPEDIELFEEFQPEADQASGRAVTISLFQTIDRIFSSTHPIIQLRKFCISLPSSKKFFIWAKQYPIYLARTYQGTSLYNLAYIHQYLFIRIRKLLLRAGIYVEAKYYCAKYSEGNSMLIFINRFFA